MGDVTDNNPEGIGRISYNVSNSKPEVVAIIAKTYGYAYGAAGKMGLKNNEWIHLTGVRQFNKLRQGGAYVRVGGFKAKNVVEHTLKRWRMKKYDI